MRYGGKNTEFNQDDRYRRAGFLMILLVLIKDYLVLVGFLSLLITDTES